MPDPSCNPYLAFAVMLAAGLDGVQTNADPGPPVDRNIYAMSEEERTRHGISALPADLGQALEALQADEVVRTSLPTHVYDEFLRAKRAEWHEYIAAVHAWETDRYLSTY